MLKLKTPWTAARQAPLSLGLSRQEYWNGLPCPPPGDIPNPRIKPIPSMPPALPGELLYQSVQLSSVHSHPTLCDPINRACQASLPTTNSRSLPKLMSIESVMPCISSSDIPFSSRLQSFPTSGSFHMSQLFASGGQNTGVSASTSVLPMNTQD